MATTSMMALSFRPWWGYSLEVEQHQGEEGNKVEAHHRSFGVYGEAGDSPVATNQTTMSGDAEDEDGDGDEDVGPPGS